MNNPEVPVQGWFNNLSMPTPWAAMSPSQFPVAEMTMNVSQPREAGMPMNAPQPLAAEVRRKRGRPYGSKTQVRHPPKSAEQLAKEKKKRQEKKAAMRRQAAVVPGSAQRPPNFGAMGDVDAMQITRAAPALRSNPLVPGSMENVGHTEFSTALPVLTPNPPAPHSSMSNIDYLPIPDESLASVPAACQNIILTTLGQTPDENISRSGHHHVGLAESTSWAQEAWRGPYVVAAEEEWRGPYVVVAEEEWRKTVVDGWEGFIAEEQRRVAAKERNETAGAGSHRMALLSPQRLSDPLFTLLL